MFARQSIRRGFTLIELLVVIAIIGLLTSLLLPALSVAMESVRSVTCRSRLKQLGVALIAYHSTHGVLPAAADGGTASVYMSFTGYGRLLTYLERRDVYDLLNYDATVRIGTLDYSWAASGNTTAYGVVLDQFLCPSNRRDAPTPLQVALPSSDGMIRWQIPRTAVTDYLFSGGADRMVDVRFARHDRRGAFGFYSATRISDIRDGTTNTFLMGESVGGGRSNPFYAVDDPGAGGDGSFVDAETGETYRRRCVSTTVPHPSASFPVLVDNYLYQAYGRNRAMAAFKLNVIGGVIARTVDAHGNFYAPNDCAYSSATDIFVDPPGSAETRRLFPQSVPNFRSAHPGTLHFLMADGSVLAVNESIDADTYMAMSTIEGSDLVGATEP
jgi:prepilin-type N-terminal cleavage/methylation domain-containing protein/prepilin-type processing-associated H-X9-DG protein